MLQMQYHPTFICLRLVNSINYILYREKPIIMVSVYDLSTKCLIFIIQFLKKFSFVSCLSKTRWPVDLEESGNFD